MVALVVSYFRSRRIKIVTEMTETARFTKREVRVTISKHLNAKKSPEYDRILKEHVHDTL